MRIEELSVRGQIIYNSLKRLVIENSSLYEMHQGLPVLNEAQGLFLAQELEKLEEQAYMVQFPELKMRKIFSMVGGLKAGQQSGGYKRYKTVGKMEWANGAANDIPRVGTSAEKFTGPFVPGWISYEFDWFEMLSAAEAGVSLEETEVFGARQASEEKIDKTILFGDDTVGVTGWLNNSEIPTGNVPNGSGGTPEWSTKDEDEILLDINSLYIETEEETNEVESPKKLALPTAQKHILQTRRLPNLSTTLWKYIKENSTWLKDESQLVSIPEFKGAGAGSSDIMISFDPDPRKVQYELPLDTTFLPAKEELLRFITPVVMKCGGLRLRYPKSMRRKEGI